MQTSRPIALWAVPRSVSTAFERVFVERGDFKVFHEPFSASYYYSAERQSDRYPDHPPKEEYDAERVLERLMRPAGRPVFFKDMAYHAKALLSPEFAARFTNTFIIREPKYMLVSLHEMWPDFTLEETGYEHQHRLFRYATEDCGQPPVVVDAGDLGADPEGIVAAYCQKIGVSFKPEALSWEAREVPEWEMWDEWHERAQKSTGIRQTEPEEEVELPAELREAYEHCRPYYEAMYERRLTAG